MTRKSKTAKAPSTRQLRVGEELRHALAGLFLRQEIFVEELQSLSITVSEVSVSPDLSNARVYVMPLGGMQSVLVLSLLNDLAPKISHLIAGRVHLRRMPRLKFLLDDSFDTADRMGRLFQKIASPPADPGEI